MHDQAFLRLYARHESRLLAYCRSTVEDEKDAKDALQNAAVPVVVATAAELTGEEPALAADPASAHIARAVD